MAAAGSRLLPGRTGDLDPSQYRLTTVLAAAWPIGSESDAPLAR